MTLVIATVTTSLHVANAQTQAVPSVALPAASDVEAIGYSELCERGTKNDDRDLCQQWRMANAAEQQIEWLKWQFFATTIEVAALMVTLLLTSWASVAASRAARAAEHSVSVASQTAERQLRAYVLPKSPKIEMQADGRLSAQLTFENAGQTPAYDFSAWGTIATLPKSMWADPPLPPEDRDRMSQAPVRPGGKAKIGFAFKNPVPVSNQAGIAQEQGAVFLYGKASYRDIFGQQHTCTFRFMYTGEWGGTRSLNVCPTGNHAD